MIFHLGSHLISISDFGADFILILLAGDRMLGFKCFSWSRIRYANVMQTQPDNFYLPDSIPQWPEGTGFATSRIYLGELEVSQVTKFELICGTDGKRGLGFYKPISIPEGLSLSRSLLPVERKPFTRVFPCGSRIQHVGKRFSPQSSL